MKSPFPGMDPYIEANGLWEDFHAKLIGEIERGFSPAVPERYSVRLGERAYVVLADSEFKTTEYRETFIEIYESSPEQRLVTVIEVLSPSNKRYGTPAWELYQRKRQALLMGGANFVEIDLLQGGKRMPMLDPWPSSPYYILVARRENAANCRVRPAHFRRPSPSLSIPLAKPDPDVMLPLQPMIETIYARARYYRDIDYSKPVSPPFSPEEAAWLQQQLTTVRAKK
jgi:hypothetical protein